MSRKIIHTVVLAALAGWSALALAEDPPGVVGRISAVQGQVTLVGDGEPVGAGLNWPVTADNHLTTASGARTMAMAQPALGMGRASCAPSGSSTLMPVVGLPVQPWPTFSTAL